LIRASAMLPFSVFPTVFFFVIAAGLVVNNVKPSESIGAQPIASFHSSGGQQRPLSAIRIDPEGKTYVTQILKQQLANELQLPLRDLRFVDPSYPSQIQATFISRSRAVLFSIENIKVVLKHNEALIFSPTQEEVQKFIPMLQQQLLQMARNNLSETAVMDEFHSTNHDFSLNLNKFELIVIETALHLVCSNLFSKVRMLEPAVASALNDLRAESRGLDVMQTQVDELLPLKNLLDELRKRVKEIKRAINEVLENDDDMAMMCLSARHSLKTHITKLETTEVMPTNSVDASMIQTGSRAATPTVAAGDVMAVETLFENYLHETEWIASEVDDLLDEITNTEENVVLQLDLLRNRILRFELTLSISSFVMSFGAVITGAFGMNLISHLENNKSMFYVISLVIIGVMASLYQSLNRYAKYQKLF
jgi:magnesium transporter